MKRTANSTVLAVTVALPAVSMTLEGSITMEEKKSYTYSEPLQPVVIRCYCVNKARGREEKFSCSLSSILMTAMLSNMASG